MRVFFALLVLVTLALCAGRDQRVEPKRDPSPLANYLPRSVLSTGQRPVVFGMNGHRLVFARAYLFYSAQWSGGDVSELYLHALLPEIEPPTDSNLQEFERAGWGKKIDLSITDAHRLRDAAEVKAWDFSHIQPRSFTKIEYGLIRYNQRYIFSRDNLYVPVTPHPDIGYFECSIRDQVLISPDCEVGFYYDNDLYVNYAYSKDYLPRWREVHERVRRFIAEHSG